MDRPGRSLPGYQPVRSGQPFFTPAVRQTNPAENKISENPEEMSGFTWLLGLMA